MSSTYPLGQDERVRAWLAVRKPLESQLTPLGMAALNALAPSPGERVLDVGCGVGGTPAALAKAVSSKGRVTAIDVLPGAIDAIRPGLGRYTNVELIAADAETFAFTPEAFDAVFSRFGMMFFATPAQAFANLRRSLRPGGRLGFVCWRGLDENPLDHVPLHAAAAALPAGMLQTAGEGGPFSFADPAVIHAALEPAGFRDVTVTQHDQEVGSGSLEAMIEVCSRVGALGKILRENPQYRDAAVSALATALAPLDGPAGPQLRASTWIVTARN